MDIAALKRELDGLKIEDNAKKDQYEDYMSRNEGYVVETPEQLVAWEFANVKLPFEDGGATVWR